MVHFPEDVTDSFILSSVQMGTGAYTAFYSTGKWGAFPGDIAAGIGSQAIPSFQNRC